MIDAAFLLGPQIGRPYASAANVTLSGANVVGQLGGFTSAGNLVVNDGTDLAVIGTLSAGANITLTVGSLTIPGSLVSTGGGTIDLITRGTIGETGTLAAGTLAGSAASASLAGATPTANSIGTLAGFVTAGDFLLDDGAPLTVIGTVSAGGSAGGPAAPSAGNTAHITLAANGALAIGTSATAGLLNAGTVTLLSPGAIGETNGTIQANLLNGSTTGATYAAAALVGLGGANAVTALGDFVSAGGLALSTTQGLTVLGTIQAGAASTLALATGGALTIGQAGTAGLLSGGTVSLLAPGDITEPNGGIDATLLIGPNAGAIVTAAHSATLDGTNIVAGLGAFTVTTDFRLADAAGLTVLGTVQSLAGTTIDLAVGGSLAIGSLATPGTLSAAGGAVLLDVAGDITEPSGAILAATLLGPGPGASNATAASATLDSAANSIATLGGFTAAGAFDLVDSRGLTVAGRVAAGNGATLGLTVNGALSLGTAGAAAALAAGTVRLDAAGDITEPNGAIAAGTLDGPQVGLAYARATSIALGGANAIGVLAGLNATGDVALNDVNGLTVLGRVSAGGLPAPNAANGALLALTANGDLTLGGAGAAALLNGGTVALVATGTIGEPNGLIDANLLQGSRPGAVYASAAALALGAGNSIATLGDFAATGDFSLASNQGLTVLGAVSAGPANSLVLTANGDLAIGGAVPGSLTAGTVILNSPGAITEQNGAITAAALVGPQAGQPFASATSAALTGTNSIGTLAGFATSGDFTLDDSTGLTVVGAVQAGGVLAPNAANTATLTLVLPGLLTLGVPGTAANLNAGTVLLDAGGGIAEPNGSIGANLLAGPTAGAVYASAGGAISLAGGGNAVTTLGGMTTTAGAISLQDATSLVIAGPLAAGDSVIVTVHGGLTLAGPIIGNNGVALIADQSITQAAGAITASGPAGVTLAANGGDIVQAAGGIVNATAPGAPVVLRAANGIGFAGFIGGASPNVTLNAGAGGIAENTGGAHTGQLSAGSLTGAAAGAVLLDGAANRIAGLDGLVSGGRLVLLDQSGLQISGSIVSPGDLTITAAGAISQNGGLIQSSAGNVTLSGATGIGIGGSIVAAAPGTVLTLDAPAGGIAENPNGHLQAGNLVVASGGSASLGNPINRVVSLGSVTVGGAFALAEAQDMTVSGPIIGGTGVTLSTAGNLFLPVGTHITSPSGAVDLVSGGVFDLAAGSVVSGTTIGIVAPGTVSLAGTLSGGRIVLTGPGDAPAGALTVLPGALFATGTAGSFQLTQAFASLPTRLGSSPGAYLYTTNFLQSGGFIVTGLPNGAPATLRVDTAGDAVFDMTSGLAGPQTTLIVDILGTGTITGNVVVKGLFVTYPVGVTASANLSGSVNGLGGQTAAEAGAISPQQNSRFRFNACPIGSVNCIVLPIEGVPLLNPTSELNIGNFRDTDDNSDLLLPLISDKDY